MKKQIIKTLFVLLIFTISSKNLFSQTNSTSDSLRFNNFKRETNLDSFIGKQKIKILYRGVQNISKLDIQGEILIAENGITLTNVMLFEDILRCAFDFESFIPLKKGNFPIRALKSIYGEGIFMIDINNGVGSVTLPYSKNKNETVSFVVIE
jgi:hypothetical protein